MPTYAQSHTVANGVRGRREERAGKPALNQGCPANRLLSITTVSEMQRQNMKSEEGAYKARTRTEVACKRETAEHLQECRPQPLVLQRKLRRLKATHTKPGVRGSGATTGRRRYLFSENEEADKSGKQRFAAVLYTVETGAENKEGTDFDWTQGWMRSACSTISSNNRTAPN